MRSIFAQWSNAISGIFGVQELELLLNNREIWGYAQERGEETDRFIPVNLKYGSIQLLEVCAWARRSGCSHILTGFSSFSFHQYENVSPFIAYYRIFHYWTIPCSMFFLCSIVILLISEEVTALFYLYREDGLWNQTSWVGALLSNIS